MKKSDYVYVTYIQTKPEKAWQAVRSVCHSKPAGSRASMKTPASTENPLYVSPNI